jgi:hypothetical protein
MVTMKKIIERDHQFSRRINHVRLGRKYAYVSGEHWPKPVRVRITDAVRAAFVGEDWDFFYWESSR